MSKETRKFKAGISEEGRVQQGMGESKKPGPVARTSETTMSSQSDSISAERYSLSEIKDMVYNALMETDTDSIYIKDCQGRFQIINQRVNYELSGNGHEQIIGKTDIDLFGKKFGSKTLAEEQVIYTKGEALADLVEWREETPTDRYWTSTTKIPLKDNNGQVVGLIGITRNISQLKIHEENLQHMVCHDPLTGVYNRIGLVDRLGELSNQPDNLLAILAIDLDNFKQINDHYFHKTGDEFLKWFSWMLKSTMRGNDVVARMGGDEFVVVMDKIQQVNNASLFCEKLYNNFNGTVDTRFKELGVGFSTGISIYPHDSTNPNFLIDQADEALYFAKQNCKGGYRYFRDLRAAA
jgi:diguanylate cyclase (GGDEF)-like protein/PAS domain S-box-containing protein